MALTKEQVIDKVEVVENGTLQVREVTRIMEDGKQLSSSYHRWSFAPNSDVSAMPANVQAIAAAAECHRLRVANGHLCTDNLLFVCGAAARDCRSRQHQYDPCPYQHINELAGSGVTAARVAAEWTACNLPNRICTQPKRAMILRALP